MEVYLAPDVEQRLKDLAGRVGIAADELVRDVVTGYLGGVAEVRGTLDARYEDLKSGRVAPIDGETFFEQLRLRERKVADERTT